MRMRIILFLNLFILQLGLSQTVLEQRFDFAVKDIAIPKALELLQEQTKIDIAYSRNFFNRSPNISISLNHETLETILRAILKSTNIDFKLINHRVVLFQKKSPAFFTISGYIKDEKTGERLVAATVYDTKNNLGAITNEYGFFSLTLPGGEALLHFQHLGYQKHTLPIVIEKKHQYNISLVSNYILPEIVVTPEDENYSSVQRSSDNTIQINKNFTSANPGAGGEVDFIRTAQLLPGVQGGVDGLGGVQVRGGENGHNLMLMDGVPIYIPYHLLGIYSVFNSSTVNSAQLLKGSFSSRYGGRLSSVFDVRIKEGSREGFRGEAGVNLINGRLLLEGPIQGGKGSFMLAGRYAPNGILLNREFKRIYFQTDVEDSDLESSFGDYNLKFNYKVTNKDHLYLSIFSGQDDFFRTSFFEDFENFETSNTTLDFNWKNTIGTLRWNHLFSDKLFSNATLTYSAFQFNNITFEEVEFFDEEEEFAYLENSSTNSDIGFNIDFDYIPNAQHTLRFGLAYSRKDFITSFIFLDEEDPVLEDIDDVDFEILQDFGENIDFNSTEMAIYAEDKIQFSPKWFSNIGIRSSAFINANSKYYNIEPRLTVRYQYKPKLSFYGSLSRMVQYLHLVTNTALRLPNDLWVMSEQDISPATSTQGELGLNYQINEHLSLQADVYYKEMSNLLAYPEDSNFLETLDLENLNTFITSGKGTAYGLELFLKYSSERLQIGGSYVLSRSERQFDAHNLGKIYPHDYDQRHQIKFYYYQQLGKHFSLGANWVFNSPNPQWSLADIRFSFDPEIPRLNPLGERNQLRSTPYNKIDINIGYEFKSPQIAQSIKLGIYNLTNRQNTIFYTKIGNEKESVGGFPILPMLSYSINFQKK